MLTRGKLAVVAVVALMALPTALTAAPHEQSVVTSHATYADMDGLDPCLASIVGMVRLRVMWFGGQVLFERSASEGNNYIYAIEHDAPDPTDQVLRPTGEQFAFSDPNGVDWTVVEYNFTAPLGTAGGGYVNVTPPSAGTDGVHGGDVDTNPPSADNLSLEWSVWVVKTGASQEDFAATGRSYNFVTMVDVCKFHEDTTGVDHNETGGNWSSSDPDDTTFDSHLAGETSHHHGEAQVDLYVAGEPKVQTFQDSADPDYLGEVAP